MVCLGVEYPPPPDMEPQGRGCVLTYPSLTREWDLGYHGIQFASGRYAIYWNAFFLQGMSVLADRLPDEVLPCLTEQYTKRADKHTSPELRIKVGEVLVKTCRNMGEFREANYDKKINKCV